MARVRGFRVARKGGQSAIIRHRAANLADPGVWLREKELRIALVCFGGVSLAVYMHGVTKEILKLVRASSALHGIRDRIKRRSAAFHDGHDPSDPEYDTEAIYFELLRDIGRSVELRVIIDIIAGASAGGINATMLARALSHDLPMGSLRDLWLEQADVAELLAEDARARSWSKWFLRPFFWASGLAGLQFVQDQEVRAKLSLFMRSRWFRPPLDGSKMTALMYDALTAMGPERDKAASLLPSGQGLDLYVTVTDFYGRQQLMPIHDPPVIHEREHRHVLHFKYRRRLSGTVESDFELANVAALAFAARATSSIPGAWPPAQILEVDQLLRARAAAWPRRAAFIATNFEQYAGINVDAASVPFVDGSVLNSRPFREAIAAIRGRPAYREVDRRVVYIDPNPAAAGAVAHHALPGFFATLKGALSDIPLNEPVTDELSWVARFNERARRLRAMIDSARPHISALVAEVMADRPDAPIDEGQIRSWRERANSKAARDAGFAYEAYVRLKLASVRSFVSRLIMDIRGVRAGSPFARAIEEIIDAWSEQAGVSYAPTDGPSLQAEAATDADAIPQWAAFLLAFDVDYRRRRLHFLIQGQNRLYQMLESAELAELDAAAVDGLKRWLYECLETLERREAASSINAATRELVEDIFRTAPSHNQVREIGSYARSFAARQRDKLDMLVARLGVDIDLKASTRDIDILLAECRNWPRRGLHEVLVNYLGFPFWDVLTFPLMPWREAGEFNEIRVDRISAQDAASLERFGTLRLKGAALNMSAAFLSRAYRENDYLLGRLHAVDRLIDIVCDAAGADAPPPDAVAALKRKAILRILAAEEAHLPTCNAIVTELRAGLADKEA
jgi:patatin-related protein